MSDEARRITVGIVCYWVGALIALVLPPHASQVHLAILVVGGLGVPIALTLLSRVE